MLLLIQQNPSSHTLFLYSVWEAEEWKHLHRLSVWEGVQECNYVPFSFASLQRLPSRWFEDPGSTCSLLVLSPGGNGGSWGAGALVQWSSVAWIKWRVFGDVNMSLQMLFRCPGDWCIHQTIPCLCFWDWKFWKGGSQIQGSVSPFIQAPGKEVFLPWCPSSFIVRQLQNLQCLHGML